MSNHCKKLKIYIMHGICLNIQDKKKRNPSKLYAILMACTTKQKVCDRFGFKQTRAVVQYGLGFAGERLRASSKRLIADIVKKPDVVYYSPDYDRWFELAPGDSVSC